MNPGAEVTKWKRKMIFFPSLLTVHRHTHTLSNTAIQQRRLSATVLEERRDREREGEGECSDVQKPQQRPRFSKKKKV